ncbi:MAG TPA: GNAT family N-acetyltransferase [Solirubrobacteraceae bacterium]|jgi:CelD/BcsL family acetyltransferase involved in cellulose biosynthesis|nr:GNAT family N-acetyltransferase [Solirubrobacteraceae bacterium]
MKVSVVHPLELGGDELAAWRGMQESNPGLANPFLSPGFALAAGRVRPTARVAVLEERQDVVGFFPFDLGRFRVGRPIAPRVSDCQAIIHCTGFEWNARELLKGCGLDVWEFDHLIADQMASAGHSVSARDSPIIEISLGYETYLAERQRISKKTFTSTFSKLRKLERKLGPMRFQFDAEDPQALDVLMRWKSAQYRRTGHRDLFTVDWVVRLIWDLFETRSDGCTGTLSVLRSDSGVVAAHFGLRSESSLSCWFPAYDVTLAKYSPGLSLFLKMAELAEPAGIHYLDLGKGDEDYKQSLKNADLTVAEGWTDRPSATAVARRIQRAPRRVLVNFIFRHPPLRRAARRVLKQVGRMRSST